MRRRQFVAIAFAGMAAPTTVLAEQPARVARIGFLLVGLSPESKEAQSFRRGLRDAGYAEGRDIVIEWRSAKGDYDRVPGLLAELLNSKLDVIVLHNTVATEL